MDPAIGQVLTEEPSSSSLWQHLCDESCGQGVSKKTQLDAHSLQNHTWKKI